MMLGRPHLKSVARVLPKLFYSSTAAQTSIGAANERIRRSLFYVPVSEEKKIQKSLKSKADCIIYDMEDGVSINRKGKARELVLTALQSDRDHKADLAVRINSVGSGLELDDLQVILQSKKLDTIIVPKVQSAHEINFVAQTIDLMGSEAHRNNIKLVACVESALGIMNLKEIATCNSKVDALLFAAEDYCSDTEIVRTPSRAELYYARSAVSTAAHAYGLQAIDMVCMDFKDTNILTDECLEGVRMGFTGKQVIHPDQVDIVQECFLPRPEILTRALRIVRGFEKAAALGIGAFDLDGKAIDMPVVKWAHKIIHRAKLGGIDIDSFAKDLKH